MVIRTAATCRLVSSSNNSSSSSMSQLPMNTAAPFQRERHIRYFSDCLRQLPEPYSNLDTNRLTLVHFCVHALDLMGALEEQVNVSATVEWIYSLQQVDKGGGFCGGTFLSTNDESSKSSCKNTYAHSHIAMTYTALATLVALGDDLSRVDTQGIVSTLRQLQRGGSNNYDGSFQAIPSIGSEHDLRFLYCACAISYMLNDWSGIDTNAAVRYIQKCVSYDGGVALLPNQEGHGGSTFCAVASLILMKVPLHQLGVDFEKSLLHWCVSRQVGGMQGRPNKAEDTCYSYWIGGTLRLLHKDHLLDQVKLNQFVLGCQTQMGGFSKVMGVYPDVLHSFYSMAWLSLSSENKQDIGLKPLNCSLGICQDRADRFERNAP